MKITSQLTIFLCSILVLQGCKILKSKKNANPISPNLSNLYFGRTTHQFSGRDVHNIFTIKENGTGLLQLTFTPTNVEHDNMSPAVSPDGTRIAYMTMRHRNDPNNGNTSEIYVMDIDGTNRIRLSNNNGIDDDGPRWCNNSRLLYTRNGEIIEIDATDANNDGNGDNPVIIVSSSPNPDNYAADCSSNNIVFLRSPGQQVILADRNGNNETILAGGGIMANSQPRFSPNGLRIVYGSSIASLNTGMQDIYTMDAADLNGDQQGDNRLRITTSSYGAGSSNPVWSPAADYIAYSKHMGSNFEIRKLELSSNADSIVVAAPPNGFLGDWR